MPIERRVLREKFTAQNYEKAVAKDIFSYPKLVSLEDGERAVDNFVAWKKKDKLSGQRSSPGSVILPGTATKNTFDTIYKNINKQPIKAAECSNFAGHAMAVLLNDPEVVREYNVCLASIDRIHNIVILLPKDAPPLSDIKKTAGILPDGSLIVDPWAVAMGHNPKKALAVRPENYAIKAHLENIEIHYQSIHDRTIQTIAPLTSAPDTPRASYTASPAPTSPRTPTMTSPVPPSPGPQTAAPPVPAPTGGLPRLSTEDMWKRINANSSAPITPTAEKTQSMRSRLESIKTSTTDAKSQKPELKSEKSGSSPGSGPR